MTGTSSSSFLSLPSGAFALEPVASHVCRGVEKGEMVKKQYYITRTLW
jgi:hypothetical protein